MQVRLNKVNEMCFADIVCKLESMEPCSSGGCWAGAVGLGQVVSAACFSLCASWRSVLHGCSSRGCWRQAAAAELLKLNMATMLCLPACPATFQLTGWTTL